MATITEDLVQGHRLRDVRGGSTITRTFRATQLVAAPHSQLVEAIQDPGVPKVGDQYPGGLLLFVQSVDAFPDGPNAARVECNYSVLNRPQGGTWNQGYPAGRDGQDVKAVTWGTKELTTTRDRGDNPMTITPPASATNWGKPYLSEARIPVPVGSLVFERVETAPSNDRIRQHVGTVNSLAMGFFAANTLKFSRYESYSDDGGLSWNSTYTFEYDPDGWAHRDRWKEDGTGRPPDDAVEFLFDVLRTSNFNDLNLNFGDTQTPL